ncbi:LysR family transcriptional regulator [Vandammella animalimorsus]|uniref:LysR family transcriptional regulator n=1 Tax=Vandammella animalimorsus TaxID=2029117 RepID=A0A2A2AE86_9BURK|nr:LysR family transcriptional regulator [Vandammella animalimorsus]PAT36850.1 LysR family transcriptional regulator [Vandammella animalimorsus]PAT40411.1 LysR family transcriptional regulator [Vandammella animalimorsus]
MLGPADSSLSRIPLAALRYFDVAAQTGSFAQAAQRLHVTHSAVSRQIRQLEQALGVALFERRNRAVFLTAQGRLLQATTSAAFAQLDGALQQLRQRPDSQRLVLSCEPTLAMNWLIPRLPSFQRQYPDISLHLLAAGGPIDLQRSGVDLALRRNDFVWDSASVHASKICDEWIGPVCRNRQWPRGGLAQARRLHTATRPDAWANWQRLQHPQRLHASGGHAAKAASATGSAPGTRRAPRQASNQAAQAAASQAQHYEHFYLSIQAAAAGLGVAMASVLMVHDALASGQLHAPQGFVRDGSSYHLLSRVPWAEASAACLQLRQWLQAEAAACCPQPPACDATDRQRKRT